MSNKGRTAIIWFKNTDLRLADNHLFAYAHSFNRDNWLRSKSTAGQQCHFDRVLPVYCFDHQQYQTTSFGLPKTGYFRAKFIQESVSALRTSLQTRESNLIVRRGDPAVELAKLAKEVDADCVLAHEEVCAEELQVERDLRNRMKEQRLETEIKTFWGNTLVHIDDLPFNPSDLPNTFTSFRKQVEKKHNWHIRDPAESTVPAEFPLRPLPGAANLDAGDIPSLAELGFQAPYPAPDTRGVLGAEGGFQGGEEEGWKRLVSWMWEGDHLQRYKETRNGLIGADYSSKFSPWLSHGCITAAQVYGQCKKYERERVENTSTYWLVFELLWRDYMKFYGKCFGNSIFYLDGPAGAAHDNEGFSTRSKYNADWYHENGRGRTDRGRKQRGKGSYSGKAWNQDWELFDAWREGRTGYPFIDANMRELRLTGWMSNRGRQCVASFLTKDMKVDWRMGAEWFETCLLDHDPCSNFGNWGYVAGVGSDPRQDRYFNIMKQQKTHDPQSEYRKMWVPEGVNKHHSGGQGMMDSFLTKEKKEEREKILNDSSVSPSSSPSSTDVKEYPGFSPNESPMWLFSSAYPPRSLLQSIDSDISKQTDDDGMPVLTENLNRSSKRKKTMHFSYPSKPVIPLKFSGWKGDGRNDKANKNRHKMHEKRNRKSNRNNKQNNNQEGGIREALMKGRKGKSIGRVNGRGRGNGRTRVSGGAVGGVGSGGWASLSNAAGGFQNSALSGSRNRAGPMDQFLQQ